MGRKFSKYILWLMGWNTSGALPEGINKAVLISAPHTSYWDFVIGRFTFWAIRVNIRFLIKKEVFFFPLGILLRKLGGLPVERNTANTMVDQVVRMFNEHESLVVVITPEGTRQKVDRWKKGFYLIAQRARVPIALGYINYRNKTGGVGPIIHPSGDYEKDMKIIRDFYRDKVARYPERFDLSGK
ncbi:MAG: 1-acyl-sn-glycerol-3-phosphate acyltransferase [Bacteroidales bacterium]|jgi:1-acyl-sn-glycerol-3-phosphate acyltransferase|nr:1-acyl-sn-glycerol-3-phosphate acyltransferase [Bacteroidales bacterium]